MSLRSRCCITSRSYINTSSLSFSTSPPSSSSSLHSLLSAKLRRRRHQWRGTTPPPPHRRTRRRTSTPSFLRMRPSPRLAAWHPSRSTLTLSNPAYPADSPVAGVTLLPFFSPSSSSLSTSSSTSAISSVPSLPSGQIPRLISCVNLSFTRFIFSGTSRSRFFGFGIARWWRIKLDLVTPRFPLLLLRLSTRACPWRTSNRR